MTTDYERGKQDQGKAIVALLKDYHLLGRTEFEKKYGPRLTSIAWNQEPDEWEATIVEEWLRDDNSR